MFHQNHVSPKTWDSMGWPNNRSIMDLVGMYLIALQGFCEIQSLIVWLPVNLTWDIPDPLNPLMTNKGRLKGSTVFEHSEYPRVIYFWKALNLRTIMVRMKMVKREKRMKKDE